jgi:hypothetical protein
MKQTLSVGELAKASKVGSTKPAFPISVLRKGYLPGGVICSSN